MKRILAISFLLFSWSWAAFAQASDQFQTTTTGEKFLYVSESVKQEKLRWVIRVSSVGNDEFPVKTQAEFQKLADALTEKVFPGTGLTYRMPTARDLEIVIDRPARGFSFDWRQLEDAVGEVFKMLVIRSDIFETKFMNSNYYSYYHKGPWFIFEPKNVPGTKVSSSNKFVSNVSIVEEGDNLSITIWMPNLIQQIQIAIDKGKPYLKDLTWEPNGNPKQNLVEKLDLWGKYLQKYAGDLPASMQRFLTPEVVVAISKAADSKKEK